MMLLTKANREALVRNHHAQAESDDDRMPVVKLFNPCGAATWLLSELDPETNIAFGLCDLGMGHPELGYVSIDELRSVRLPFGLKIERDRHWQACKTLTEYAEDARAAGRITV